jgi:formylmethanofuran dehydrogenase subunit B
VYDYPIVTMHPMMKDEGSCKVYGYPVSSVSFDPCMSRGGQGRTLITLLEILVNSSSDGMYIICYDLNAMIPYWVSPQVAFSRIDYLFVAIGLK